eukprot:4147722-Heterocapsa_arctica.AAC.1
MMMSHNGVIATTAIIPWGYIDILFPTPSAGFSMTTGSKMQIPPATPTLRVPSQGCPACAPRPRIRLGFW